MSGKFPVRHERGFCLKWNQVRRGLQCGTLIWANEAHTEVRDATLAESMAIQDEQARQRALEAEIFGCGEIGGCRFIAPATTTYQQPWAALEAMCAPMMVRKCRWPRQVAA